jgi:hypothetical protein
MHFGENQLSPLSIGISPRPTRHPSGLQSTPVRASTRCYARFTLRMGSSSGFGSTPRDNRPFQARFHCGSACHSLNQPRRVTRRIILQKARRQAGDKLPRPSTACKQLVSGSISLPSPGYFSPFPHGTVHYRSLRVSSLGKWSPQLHAGFLVSGATQASSQCAADCSYGALTHSGAAFQAALDRQDRQTVANDRSPWTSFQPPRRKAGQLDTAQV